MFTAAVSGFFMQVSLTAVESKHDSDFFGVLGLLAEARL